MEAKITGTFRAKEGDAARVYRPGDVAEGKHAELAIASGYGEAIKAKKAPANKAKKAPENK